MNNTIDPVAFYAAVISTITLIWNITNAILEKMSKLDIEMKVHSNFITMSDGRVIDAPESITISVVNRSNRNKYIKGICLKLPFKTALGSNMVKQQNLKVSYPIEIKPECEYIETIYPNDSWNWVLENYKNGSFRAIVYDTTNKKYKSKKMKVKILKKSYEFNKNLPKDVWKIINNQ